MNRDLSHSEDKPSAFIAESNSLLSRSAMAKSLRITFLALFAAMSGGCATTLPSKPVVNIIQPKRIPANQTPENTDDIKKHNKSDPENKRDEDDDEDIPCEERNADDPMACRLV